jgi:thiamine pyrophosphate-dependent acetolactate synthase large subunit-like protein
MVTGEAQAVLVRVDSGIANIAGAPGNAFRGRVPVLIFAGTVPATQEGELPGGRTEFVQWIQDVRDQRGIMRNYVKCDQEIRSGRNVKQLLHRALQVARSEPAGPVYLTATREVMEEQLEPYSVDPVKPQIMTWYTPARRFAAASTKLAVEQITEYVRGNGAGGTVTEADRARIERRRVALAERHAWAVAALEEAEQPRDDVITAEFLSACVRRLVEGTDALVLTELVTSSKVGH